MVKTLASTNKFCVISLIDNCTKGLLFILFMVRYLEMFINNKAIG